MFLTTHAVTGIALSQTTTSLPLVFILSFLSHIPLDIIPHGDNILVLRFNKESKKISLKLSNAPNTIKNFLPYALIDVVLLGGFCFYIFFISDLDFKIAFTAIFGALLVDFISIVYKTTKWRFLHRFEKLHYGLHQVFAKYLPRGDISPVISISLQIFFVIVVLGTLII